MALEGAFPEVAKGLLQELRGERRLSLKGVKNSASEQLCGFRRGSQGLWVCLLYGTRIINHECLPGHCEDSVGHVYRLQSSAHCSCGYSPFQMLRGALSRTDSLALPGGAYNCQWLADCCLPQGPTRMYFPTVCSLPESALPSPCGPALGNMATCPQSISCDDSALGQDQTIGSDQWLLPKTLQQLGLMKLTEVLVTVQL